MAVFRRDFNRRILCAARVCFALPMLVFVAGWTQESAGGKIALDAMERQRVLDAVVANLRAHYVDHAIAEQIAKLVFAHEKSGEYATKDATAFADRITKDMRAASGDMHLELFYSEERLPDLEAEPSAEEQASHRRRLEEMNCAVAKAEILPHNIGYLKMDWFPEPSICEAQVRGALERLNHADAMIIDLRDNRGGIPEMVSLVASYFFDHPEYMFNPREAPSVQSWTRSPVAGNKLADKPVFILTSRTTFSGAEQFCYNMKNLKRAKLIGETTGGGAHAGVPHRIDDHFGLAITEVRTVNPYGKNDWEGVGVEPDVKVKAEDALETAKEMALSQLRGK
jgi:C-terminal processing protease CtpA/Prc